MGGCGCSEEGTCVLWERWQTINPTTSHDEEDKWTVEEDTDKAEQATPPLRKRHARCIHTHRTREEEEEEEEENEEEITKTCKRRSVSVEGQKRVNAASGRRE